jgi:arabinan endo-1,5-alpha-L-arabinosidase
LLPVLFLPDLFSISAAKNDSPANCLLLQARVTDRSNGNPPAINDNPKDAGGNAIEAPFIFRKGKYFCLLHPLIIVVKALKVLIK